MLEALRTSRGIRRNSYRAPWIQGFEKFIKNKNVVGVKSAGAVQCLCIMKKKKLMPYSLVFRSRWISSITNATKFVKEFTIRTTIVISSNSTK